MKKTLKSSATPNSEILNKQFAGVKSELLAKLGKREELDTEKANCLNILRPLISTIKLAKLLPDHDARTRPSTPPTELLMTSVGDMEIPGSRRNHKRYTPEEVRMILHDS